MSLSAYPPPMRTSSSLPLQADGIHGISPRKVYTATSVTTRAVGSYPTFSPLPALESRVGKKTNAGGIFSAALSVVGLTPSC